MDKNRNSQVEGPDSAALQSHTSPPPRILVVEDDGEIRRLNAEVLMRSGYEVKTAEDGAAAWEALSAESYDLLITDHNMPKVTGVELLTKLHGARMVLPVIMATGSLPEEELARQPGIQPNATLLKPYTIDELLVKVREILSRTCAVHRQGSPLRNLQGDLSADSWQQ